MSHYEERLQQDLDRIRRRVGAVGDLVKKALDDAVRALLTGNDALAHMTVLRDGPINRKTRAIDTLCHEFIAVHLPSAGLLRLVSTIIRANIALERIGDYAVTISRESMQLSEVPRSATARELELLADEARGMLAKSIDALNGDDAELAKGTMQSTNNLQRRLETVYTHLLQSKEYKEPKELIAVFVVFNMLKRVSDQAKNLCEETIFAATGEGKPLKTYKILFADQDNALASQMARAIGSKNHPDACIFYGAGATAASEVHPALVQFLDSHGSDISGRTPTTLDSDMLDLSSLHVIVSLAGPVSRYIKKLPFHTAALEWDIGPPPEPNASPEAVQQRLEEMYRELSVQIRDLVEILSGPDAD